MFALGRMWGKRQGRREEALAKGPGEPSWQTPLVHESVEAGKRVALKMQLEELKSDHFALQEEHARLQEKSAAQEARNAYLEKTLEDTRRRLNAARAVRDTLRNALAQVAPDHQYVNPLSQNPLLVQVADAGYLANLDSESK